MNSTHDSRPLFPSAPASGADDRFQVVPLGLVTIVRGDGRITSERFAITDTHTGQLAPHPGLGVPRLYEDRAEASRAVNLIYLVLASEPTQAVFTGWILVDGKRVQVDFAVPVTASKADRALAFVDALAQCCELEYLCLGQLPGTSPPTPSRPATASPTSH